MGGTVASRLGDEVAPWPRDRAEDRVDRQGREQMGRMSLYLRFGGCRRRGGDGLM